MNKVTRVFAKRSARLNVLCLLALSGIACNEESGSAMQSGSASCMNSDNATCSDYFESFADLDTSRSECEKSTQITVDGEVLTIPGGTWSQSPCTTENRLGSCRIFGGSLAELTLRYYPPTPPQNAEDNCRYNGGTYTPG